MGIDQYAYAIENDESEPLEPIVDIFSEDIFKKIVNSEVISVWFRYIDLHRWIMANVFNRHNKKKGRDQYFSLVQLTHADIDQLEQAIYTREIYGWINDYHTTLAFVEKARESLKKGKLIYYIAY